jgi:hypothetical protein
MLSVGGLGRKSEFLKAPMSFVQSEKTCLDFQPDSLHSFFGKYKEVVSDDQERKNHVEGAGLFKETDDEPGDHVYDTKTAKKEQGECPYTVKYSM